MSQGLELLDEALDLARLEKKALEDGAYETAISLAEKRGNITGMAWDLMRNEERGAYRGKMLELSGLQKQLKNIATRARDTIRETLTRSRRVKKSIQGYRVAVGQALQ